MHLAYIKITKNNINISITDIYGDVIIQKTSGSGGYRSIESNSEIASSGLAHQIALEFKNLNVSKIGVYINGVTL
jgi:ribosomal protein S11